MATLSLTALVGKHINARRDIHLSDSRHTDVILYKNTYRHTHTELREMSTIIAAGSNAFQCEDVTNRSNSLKRTFETISPSSSMVGRGEDKSILRSKRFGQQAKLRKKKIKM